MAMITETATVRPLSSLAEADLALHAHIRAEFDEMPGLKLTLWQAVRLFGVEPARCARVLGHLIETGALCSDGHLYSRPGSGRHSH
jgi:hypothetical protein